MAATIKLCECGCGKPAPISKGNWRYGKGQAVKYITGHNMRQPIVKRFWEKVNKDGPVLVPKLGKCWVWTAYKLKGYGRVSYKNKSTLAHLVSWMLSGKPTPKEQLDHLCKNRACVRPSHLEEVSNQVNSQRGTRSTLTPALVKRIRSLYASGRFTYRSLAVYLEVGKGAVDFVLRGLTWSNVK
jgi:hypothetical protein